jgi:hypothetical protein
MIIPQGLVIVSDNACGKSVESCSSATALRIVTRTPQPCDVALSFNTEISAQSSILNDGPNNVSLDLVTLTN